MDICLSHPATFFQTCWAINCTAPLTLTGSFILIGTIIIIAMVYYCYYYLHLFCICSISQKQIDVQVVLFFYIAGHFED